MLLAIEGFGWLWSIFSSFWFWLDSTILSFISTLYNFLITLSRTSILSQAQIQNFATRIQMLLGIFMLFKVSFSLIMYVVNPDDFSDKSKGVGKLAQNTIVSLILLAVVPYLFNMAYRLQSLVLEDNTLARIILGTDNDQNGDNKDSASVLLEAGDLMSYYVMIPFFQPNTGIYNQEKDYGLENCVNLMSGGSFNDSCYKALIEAVSEDDKVHIDNYKKGVESESVGLTFRLATVNVRLEDNTDEYLFNYRWPLTTVVGVIVCLLLINFCIDIAVRSVKLAFFQLIAPIPIISYMDPKSGKDGLFMKWAKMCGSTFISLFVRLVALYFGIYIISQIHTLYDVTNGSVISNPFAILFIVIGVLFFVKQLPKILESLGIKLDGDGKFNLNPFKKMEEGMLGGKVASKLPAALGGAAVGLGIGAVGAATGAGLGRTLTGMFNGFGNGLKGKKMGEIHKNQIDANKRMREARANDSTFLGRRRAQISGAIGSRGELGQIENEILQYEKQKEQMENEIAPTKAKINKFDETASSISAMQDRAIDKIKQGKGKAGQIYRDMLEKAEAYKAAGDGEMYSRMLHAADDYLNTDGRDQYIDQAINDSNFDAAFNSMYKTYKTVAGISDHDVQKNASDLDSQLGSIKGDVSGFKNSIKAKETEISTIDDQIKEANEKKRKAQANRDAVNY